MPKQEEISKLTVGRRHDGITEPASERLRDASVAVDRELATAKHGDGREGRVAGYSLLVKRERERGLILFARELCRYLAVESI